MLSRNLGVFPGHLMVAYITASASKKEGRTRESPRVRPFRSNANERLIFCNYKPQRLTQHRLLTSTAPDASKKSRPY